MAKKRKARLAPNIRERRAKARAARVLRKYAALMEQHPDAFPSRIAAAVASSERGETDGVKTLMGVKNILKRNGLWTPKRQTASERC